MTEEKWHAICEIEGHEVLTEYFVSTHGRVMSTKRNKITYLKSHDDNGYKRVQMYNKERKYTASYSVHRLVALAFLPNPRNLPIVNHIDEDTMNNHVENLEWVTEDQNIRHNNLLGRMSREIIMICTKTFKETAFPSIQEASRATGFSHQSIRECLYGKTGTYKNYYWVYADKYDPTRLIEKCKKTIDAWRGSDDRLLEVIKELLWRQT